MARRKKQDQVDEETQGHDEQDERGDGEGHGKTADDPVPFAPPIVFGPSTPSTSDKRTYQVTCNKFFINGKNVRKGTYVETDEDTAARAGSRLRLVE